MPGLGLGLRLGLGLGLRLLELRLTVYGTRLLYSILGLRLLELRLSVAMGLRINAVVLGRGNPNPICSLL